MGNYKPHREKAIETEIKACTTVEEVINVVISY